MNFAAFENRQMNLKGNLGRKLELNQETVRLLNGGQPRPLCSEPFPTNTSVDPTCDTNVCSQINQCLAYRREND